MNHHPRVFSKIWQAVALAAACAAVPLAVVAQDRISVPLTDPTRPATVRISVLNGSIVVKGSDSKEVVVEARVRPEDSTERKASGMKRIPMTSTGLSVEEENNTVRISSDSHQRTIDLTVIVPRESSLRLQATNDGDITVSGVEGDIDVNNTNGAVTLTGVSGSVVAHALNDDLRVTFLRVNPAKPMSFSSLNGEIDVTFPSDLKANISIKSDNGEVYSDFDVTLATSASQPIVQEARGKDGRYKVKIDKTVRGTIGGGGQEIRFTNYNGDIYIRKAGAAPARE
jgi:hypothetical protein